MRTRSRLACVLGAVACGCGEPSSTPAAVVPTATASLEVPPLPPPKRTEPKPVVRADVAPPPRDADANDDSPLPRDVAAAERAFQEGRAAAAAGDLVKARAAFLQSLRLDRSVGALLNLANVEEQLGDRTNAIRHFQAAYDEATKRGFADRARVAKARLDALTHAP